MPTPARKREVGPAAMDRRRGRWARLFGGRRTALQRGSVTAFKPTGFTLVEVLAALALMAIVIPVAMQGVQVASRAGALGERKATAMRVAEHVLNERIATGQMLESSASGTVSEKEIAYPWTIKSETWSEDAMDLVTIRVTFTVQGHSYEVSASTLYDPVANTPTASGAASPSTTAP